MKRLALLALLLPAAALAQSQVRAPDGSSVAVVAPACVNASGLAVPCSAATPLSISGAVTSTPAGPVPVSQSGAWVHSPFNGTPTASAVVSLGTASTLIFGAGTGLRYKLIQNQSQTATVYCNHGGGAAVAGPPSIMIAPMQVWGQGQSPGFVTSAAVSCIATAAATPLAAWSGP